jgi:two-component system phosphate regulon sensor histidine kinase PhoR
LSNFQDGVDAIPDAIVVLSASDRLLWCNPAAHVLLGIDSERDRGRKVIDLIQQPDFLTYMSCWPEQETVAFDAPNDANRKLSGQLLPYTKKKRMLWVHDITQTHRVEQIRRDFVSSASHELRTPLTVIVGYLEILRDHADTQETIWEGPLNAMQQQSDRMMVILRELLLLSRLEDSDTPNRYEPVNVPHMLHSIVTDAHSLSGERKHIILLDAQTDLWLNGDENELHSAFSNLVFNAVQHTPPGTRIQLSWYNDTNGAHLSVTDNGDGIPEQHLPRLSERFYRLDKSRQRDNGSGTGLGLAIVKHVLQRHRGELHISSEIGMGSSFRCDFPLSLVAAPRQPIGANAKPELEAIH